MANWVHSAIQNNMDWYQAQCAAHDIVDVRTDTTWYSTQPMPPLHSNLILTRAQDAELIPEIDEHLATRWSIKDATGNLDLTTHGFEVLFEAHWFVREPSDCIAPNEVSKITSEHAFSEWVAAWGESAEVFKSHFWSHPNVSFFHDNAWQGGIAANVSHDAIGITNPWGDEASINKCIQAIAHQHPTLPIVGYDHMPEIDAMSQLGFRSTAPLTVWLQRVPG